MTQLALSNAALYKVGVSQTIVALSETTREARTCNDNFGAARRETLRAFPWARASGYAALALAAGPLWDTDPAVLTNVQAWSASYTYAVGDVVRSASVNYTAILGGVNHVPPNATYWSTSAAAAPEFANGDWRYAYRLPSSFLYARRLVPTGGNGRQYNETPLRFRLGRDTNGLLLFTPEQNAELEYTIALTDTDVLDDPVFDDALSWKLAEKIGPSLSKNDKIVQVCAGMFAAVIAEAKLLDAREQQQDKAGDAPWITER